MGASVDGAADPGGDVTVGKKGRELLRGRPLSKDCYRAYSSGVEFTRDGIEYYGCYGLMDWPENYNKECQQCKAFVYSMPFDPEELFEDGDVK